jgi:DNA-binding NtrC family response regulator
MHNRILILCTEPESRDRIVASVRERGLDPVLPSTYRQARNVLAKRDLAAVFCSDALGDARYPDIIEAAKPAPVIVLSRFAEWGPYLDALRAGAFDYITCPPDAGEVNAFFHLP